MSRYRIWLVSTGEVGVAYTLPDCRPFDNLQVAEIHARMLQERSDKLGPGSTVRFEVREETVLDQAVEVARSSTADRVRELQAASAVADWYVADALKARGFTVERVGNVVWAVIGGDRYTITVVPGPD